MNRTTRPPDNRVARISILSTAVAVSLSGTTHSQTWIGPSAGSWSVGANWSGGAAPNSATADVYIDTNASQATTVTANATYTVRRLTLDAGDQLIQNNGLTLTIAGSGGAAGLINAGLYTLNSTGTNTTLAAGSNHLSISGGGTILMLGSARFTGTGTLTNIDNTIRGGGTIGGNAIAIYNQSVIVADADGMTLDPEPTVGLTNSGVLRAVNAGSLVLTGNGGGDFVNTVGSIIADDAARVILTSARVDGGTLSSSGTGYIEVQVGTLSGITNAGRILSVNSSDTYLVGTITNLGTWTIAGTTSATDILVRGGSVTLVGSGVVQMQNPAAQFAGNGTLHNASTIRGVGHLGVNAIGIVNSATIAASGGVLTLDPGAGTLGSGFVNTGRLVAENGGILALSGNGGGTFDNASGTIEALDGGVVRLTSSAALAGGTLTGSGAGYVEVPGGHTATFIDVTNLGRVVVQDSANAYFAGTITNHGEWQMTGTSTATDLYVQGAATLNGNGTFNMTNPNGIWQGSGTLLNNSTITGIGGVGGNVLSVVNAATIEAASGVLTLDPVSGGAVATFINQGVLSAVPAATLSLSGNGGGIFDNSTGTIAAAGVVRLVSNAQVVGGTLQSGGTGYVQVLGGQSGTFSGVTNLGRVVHEDSANCYFVGTITNHGLWEINGTSIATDLYVQGGTVTLTGDGSFLMNNPNGIWQGSGTLLNQSAISGRGGVGGHGIAVVNSGTLQAAGGTMTLDPVNSTIAPTFLNSGTLRAAASARLVLSGNGGGTFDSTAGAIVVDTGGPLATASSAVVATGGVALEGTLDHGSGTLTVQNIRGGGTVTIGTGTRIKVAPGGGTLGTSRIGDLQIAGSGRIDLADHDLAIDYSDLSPIGTVRSLIQTGFGGGTWGGAGLTSSAAAAAAATPDKTGLGYAEASQLYATFPADFRGVTVDDSSVLIRYTLAGDSNLDAAVNIGDFARLAAAFNTPGMWFNGDFNYDGTVGIGDFSLLAANYNKILPAGSMFDAVVPEPTAVMVGAIAGLAVRVRRPRRANRRESAVAGKNS